MNTKSKTVKTVESNATDTVTETSAPVTVEKSQFQIDCENCIPAIKTEMGSVIDTVNAQRELLAKLRANGTKFAAIRELENNLSKLDSEFSRNALVALRESAEYAGIAQHESELRECETVLANYIGIVRGVIANVIGLVGTGTKSATNGSPTGTRSHSSRVIIDIAGVRHNGWNAACKSIGATSGMNAAACAKFLAKHGVNYTVIAE